MKVTFFSGTASTTTVAAPQVIAVGLGDAEKTQLLSEINEQAAVLIDAAASSAAAQVAPAVADTIRAQVAADADRASNAASRFDVVQQRDDGTWPDRPAVAVAFWQGWDSPGARMHLPDLWFAPESYPTAPGQIPDAEWRIFNVMDGSRALLRLLQPPVAARPGILGYDYRLTYTDTDGAQVIGNPVPFPMTPGDTFITGLVNGRVYGAEISARNVQGRGPWSALRAVTVSDEPFSDNFDRPTGQKLSGTGQWRDVVSSTNHGMIIGTGGIAVPGANSRLEIALANAWMPNDQYAEAIITGAQDNDWRNPLGGHLLVRTVDYVTGYSLQFSPTGCGVRKKPNGGSGAGVTGLSYAFPAGLVYPMKARLQAVGSTLSIFINDALVAQADDTTWTSGAAGMMVYRTTGSWGFDNFKAGPAA